MYLPYTPVLVIGPDTALHMKKCMELGFPLVTGTADEISAKLSGLKNTTLNNPLVVGDISPAFAGDDIEPKLLKVLEALKAHSMFFSSSDSFSEVLLSRFVKVFKTCHPITPSSDSRLAFIKYMKEVENLSAPETLRRVITESPSCIPFYMQFRQTRIPAKHKLLELLK